jgi:hypothetical protein
MPGAVRAAEPEQALERSAFVQHELDAPILHGGASPSR